MAALAALTLTASAPVVAQTSLPPAEIQRYAEALAAAERGDWSSALRQAQGEPVLARVIQWMSYSAEGTSASFNELVAFIQANPQWPRMAQLRRRAEERLPADLPGAQVIAWFYHDPPATAAGTIRLADALAGAGQPEEAASVIRQRWPELWLNRDEQALLVARYGNVLTTADHAARLDNLLWADRTYEAERMYPLVGAGLQRVAEARLRLAGQQSGVEAAVAAVPAELAGDPGLIFERLRYRRRADLLEGAIEMLGQQPIAPSHADAWWSERHIIARRLFNAGDYQRAYNIAADHRYGDGLPVSEAEFLAGWIALRFLGRPDLAVGHFQNLYSNATAPISVARGAYWTGRALAAQQRDSDAREWYRRAAQYPTTFYGQLGAGQAGIPSISALPPDPTVSGAAQAAFDQQDLPRAVRLLTQLGRTDLAGTFLNHMIQTARDPVSFALVGRLALSVNRPFYAVRAGKRAVQDGVFVNDAAYPMIDLPEIGAPAHRALVLAVIRQESEFDPGAVSSAGARGLMQLMPGTASHVARGLGISVSNAALTSDPTQNIRLGAAYLGELLGNYGGSAVLAVAAYNAGPSRVSQWIAANGDPRQPNVDVVDWIEQIPIGETRNYVQRVLENTEVYRIRLGEAPEIGRLERDLGR